ncbi:MAG: hypothetical protein SH850_21275 [Planctomycetaceae bacterium]|nr:hypothetical protein [Planctomycetaceae bacterium]
MSEATTITEPTAPVPTPDTTPVAKRKSGPPRGNTNATKHGCASQFLRAPIGELPKRFAKISEYVRSLRQSLEAAVIRRHGDISETRALLLLSALQAEQARRCCQWQMRFADVNGALDSSVLVMLLKLGMEASRRRDEAVKALDLDASPASTWATVFDSPVAPALTEAAPETTPDIDSTEAAA